MSSVILRKKAPNKWLLGRGAKGEIDHRTIRRAGKHLRTTIPILVAPFKTPENMTQRRGVKPEATPKLPALSMSAFRGTFMYPLMLGVHF